MNEDYRGCLIHVSRSAIWHAVIVDRDTGTVFPTKATALLREGRGVALSRARELVDIYARAGAVREPRAA